MVFVKMFDIAFFSDKPTEDFDYVLLI